MDFPVGKAVTLAVLHVSAEKFGSDSGIDVEKAAAIEEVFQIFLFAGGEVPVGFVSKIEVEKRVEENPFIFERFDEERIRMEFEMGDLVDLLDQAWEAGR